MISSNLFSESLNSSATDNELRLNKDFLWEVVLPGYNFYKTENSVLGTVFLITRLATLYYSVNYYKKYISYKDLEKSAKLADLYYGGGYSYYDPVENNYKNSKAFSIYAGRSQAYFHYSLSLHLIFLGIGIYKGYVDAYEEYERKLPAISSSKLNWTLGISSESNTLSTTLSIHLDF